MALDGCDVDEGVRARTTPAPDAASEGDRAADGGGGASATSYGSRSSGAVCSACGATIAAPHVHLARLPASCGFHVYGLPHASHENFPAITFAMRHPCHACLCALSPSPGAWGEGAERTRD